MDTKVIDAEVRTRDGWRGVTVTVTWEPGTGGEPDRYALEVSDALHPGMTVRLDTEQAQELALALAPDLAERLREHDREKLNRIEHGREDPPPRPS